MSTPARRKPAAAVPALVEGNGHGPWTLEIPGWRPVLDNQLVYVHWATARRRKRADADMLMQAAFALGVPMATRRRRLTLTIRQERGRFPDDTAPWKSLLDACVKAGLLVDDSREWLELSWPPTFERGAKGTVILLEDLP